MLYSYEEILQEELNIAGERIAKLVEDYARANHRYITRTGNLENSTYATYSEQNGLEVFTDLVAADYSEYIISGFKTWSPDPFLDNAIEATSVEAEAEMEVAFDRAWERYVLIDSNFTF